MKVTNGTGKLQGKIRNYEVIINDKTLAQTFGLTHNSEKPIPISDEELLEAWGVMRPGMPMIGSDHLRKEFSPEVYLLSDIVDKVFCCKTGNKDRFTDEQLCITAAIVLRKDINWAELLHHQLKQSVLAVAQTNTQKCKFVHVINYVLLDTCPDLTMEVNELISHSSNKEINKTTLKILEQVVSVPFGDSKEPADAPSVKPQPVAKPTPTHAVSHSSPKKTKAKGKGKRPASPSPPKPIKIQKKSIREFEEMSSTELPKYTARLTVELAAIRAQSAIKAAGDKTVDTAETTAAVEHADEAGEMVPTTEARPRKRSAPVVTKGKARRLPTLRPLLHHSKD